MSPNKRKNRKMDQRRHLLSISFLLILLSLAKSDSPKTAKHFILVHGSCHGGWSWYKLVPLLKSAGHAVTALDLATSGVDPRRPKELRSISDYFGPLRELMEALPVNEKVFLVGHSLGGLAISQAMERFPAKISVAVFVTALMPGPALNISALNRESFKRQGSLMDSRFTFGNGPNNPPTTFVFGPLYLASKVYQLSPLEDLALATTLMRPLPLFSDKDMSKELKLSKNKYGSINRVYIVAGKDMVVNKDVERWMLKNNQPNEVVKINGSDHMVMMSRPLELFLRLQSIIEKYS